MLKKWTLFLDEPSFIIAKKLKIFSQYIIRWHGFSKPTPWKTNVFSVLNHIYHDWLIIMIGPCVVFILNYKKQNANYKVYGWGRGKNLC